jgi:hypothetical protein
MATTSVPDDAPYTPAGDVDEVLAGLADVEVSEPSDEHANEESVLPELDGTLVELAATIDGPAGETPECDAVAGGDDEAASDEEAAASHEGSGGGLTRERADFEEVAANTEVDSIPYENAAAFLANTLYAVPPANTRFEWVETGVETEDPTPEWDLDVDW